MYFCTYTFEGLGTLFYCLGLLGTRLHIKTECRHRSRLHIRGLSWCGSWYRFSLLYFLVKNLFCLSNFNLRSLVNLWARPTTVAVSLLPEVSPIVNKHYNICAVVGNSGILTGSQCGQEIDRSDFVFRCNFAPTEAFQRDVGRKTNLTTFNPSILEKYYNNLLTIQDRNNFFLSLKKLDGAILWIPAFFFHTSATVTRTLVDFFVEHRGQLKVQLAWPGNIMQHVNRYWKNKHLSPKRLSTGILMYTLASAICEEIHLYGFWPFGFDPNTREDLPYHYYDKKGTKFTTKWQESHQLPAEFQLLYRMHGEGLTKLTLSHCA